MKSCSFKFGTRERLKKYSFILNGVHYEKRREVQPSNELKIVVKLLLVNHLYQRQNAALAFMFEILFELQFHGSSFYFVFLFFPASLYATHGNAGHSFTLSGPCCPLSRDKGFKSSECLFGFFCSKKI